MKTAIYIEDGLVQLVITPETKFEKNALSSFDTEPLEAKIFNGTFYDCRGGWVRQNEVYDHNRLHGGGGQDDKSIILQVKKPKSSDLIKEGEE